MIRPLLSLRVTNLKRLNRKRNRLLAYSRLKRSLHKLGKLRRKKLTSTWVAIRESFLVKTEQVAMIFLRMRRNKTKLRLKLEFKNLPKVPRKWVTNSPTRLLRSK